MLTSRVVVVGAGGHGRVVLDALLETIDRESILVADDDPRRIGRSILGLVVAGVPADMVRPADRIHVAIGNNRVRESLQRLLGERTSGAATIRHSKATVSSHARHGPGCFLAAGCVVSCEVFLGDGVIVNHGAIIDHNCRVGDYSHIAPNSTLGGGVTIGARVLVGAGAVVLPGVEVEDDVTIGAGSVVTHRIQRGRVVVGSPARPLRGESQ